MIAGKHTVTGVQQFEGKAPGLSKNPINNGINYLSTCAGFLPSTVL